jgi:tetratricopeptide (TPR) repeat protein
MPEAAAKEARSAMQEAVRRAGQASAKEQALIGALAKRYSDDPKAERAALDAVYANAMRAIAAKFPDDTDILTITGEAIMDTTPWNYWTKDGKPNPGTEEVIGLLEKTLAIDPTHPGANHFYIHIVEASPFPERALSSAHRLPEITPLAGHLVHMPSHIYVRTGRYHEAVLVNERSILADSEYLTQCSRQGMYPMIYVPHNHHFLWFSATMEGASAKAIAAAEKMAAHVDKKAMRSPEMGILQNFALTPLFAKIRFGRWDEIIALPAPDKELLYPTGMWHYARGMAFARRGQHDAARKELAAVTAIASDKSLEPVSIGGLNPVTNVLKIAAAALAGEVAAEGGDFEAAISHFEKGIALQDTLNYDEPPAFHYPVRQSLGAVLLAAGRPAEAERVYREDLKRHPENGWSLFGLLQSLRALGNNTLAADTERRFREAWKHADVTLTSSRF